MKEYIKIINKAKKDNEKLNIEKAHIEALIDDLYFGTTSIREKIETMKNNSDLLTEYATELDKIKKSIELNKIIVNTCYESIVDKKSNDFVDFLNENRSFCENTPVSYKKFNKLIADFLGDDFYIHTSYGSLYLNHRKAPYEVQQTFCIDIKNDYIDFQYYDNGNRYHVVTPANEIVKTCKKAVKDSQAMWEKLEKLEKERDAIRGKYSSTTTLYRLFKEKNFF